MLITVDYVLVAAPTAPVMSGKCLWGMRREVMLTHQGGGIPMFAVLRSSSLVKEHGQAKIGLDLLKIVLDSFPISSKFCL